METAAHVNVTAKKEKWVAVLHVQFAIANSLPLCLTATRCLCGSGFSWQSPRPFMKLERPSSHHGKVTGSHSDTADFFYFFIFQPQKSYL